ncbi:MAG TPA: Crp/Fnr family transcriptional regulator [Elusimicrobiales bacterium]|nr:Crp/Fnr family transcriptional regulator [Elusimicrobiales bacterium]
MTHVWTALKKVPFFKGLRDIEIMQVIKIAHSRKYKKNEIIFRKEDLGNSFFIVKEGKVKIFTSIGGDKKKTFAFLNRGDFFGEMSLLGGRVRSASAQATEETELYVISKRNFTKLIVGNHEFTLKLLKTLADRLTRADKEIASMLFHNILGRLAEAIIELAKTKSKTPGRIAIDQSELAQYLGTTRMPVCRAVNVLKREGTIDYRRGELIILNQARLKSMAGSLQ